LAANGINIVNGADLTTRKSFELHRVASSAAAAAALAASGIHPQDFVLRLL